MAENNMARIAVVDSDSAFIIDPKSKSIIGAPEKNILAQSANKSERFSFYISTSVIEGHDLSTCNSIMIHYDNIEEKTLQKSSGIYSVRDFVVAEDGSASFSWLLDPDATVFVGGLIFSIHFANVAADGTVEYDFPTLTYSKITVGATVWNSDTIAKNHPDILAGFDARINALENGGTALEPETNDIPKVFFGGPLQQTKTEAVVPFRYISATQDISGYAEIKAQGNSSMGYPKKNQTVKLYKDAECAEKLKVDFKGWGKQNKFCFKANWIDLTHARNIVSARLWGDVVRSRTSYEELPELLRTSPNVGAVDGFPVKVYADGIYQGRYTLNIPKDKWMANMDDELDTHCILCGENYASGCFRAAANINGADWTDEIHDAVPASIKTRWNEVISFVMTSTDEEFRANLGNYFDIPSLIDYHLFGLTSCGFDAYGKNQIYMTYDGRKWIASMYDMDSTWGLYWNGSKFVASDYPRTSYEDYVSSESSGEGNLLYIRLEQLFYEELQSRWAELKTGVLSIENIINKFERFTDIASAELVAEDYAATTGNGSYTGIPSRSTNNIQQIRSFALERLAWTDRYVACLPNGTPEEPPIVLDYTSLTFTGYGSQQLVATVDPTLSTLAWSSSNEDVVTVNKNGVVDVQGDGSAVITASADGATARCEVTVSGIGARPPYALVNGTWESGEGRLTISNGCHVKHEIFYGRDRNVNLSNVGKSNPSYAWFVHTDKMFDLKTGDVVTRRLKNYTASGNVFGVGKNFVINLYTASGEFKLSADMPILSTGPAVEHTVTATQDYAVEFVCMWHNYAGLGEDYTGIMEFDLELLVNGEKYI